MACILRGARWTFAGHAKKPGSMRKYRNENTKKPMQGLRAKAELPGTLLPAAGLFESNAKEEETKK